MRYAEEPLGASNGSHLTPVGLAAVPPDYIQAPNGDWVPPDALWIPTSRMAWAFENGSFHRKEVVDKILVAPPTPEPVVRGVNMVGAGLGLVGNGLEATGAAALTTGGVATADPLMVAGGVGLGLLAADGAQANIRTLGSGGQPTPTFLSQGVAGVASYVTEEPTAQVIGGVVDAGAHMGATAYGTYQLTQFAQGAKAVKAASAVEGGSTAALEEQSALRTLQEAEANAAPGAHFLSRHGAQTTLEQQFIRARTGVTPEGITGKPVDSGRFLSHQAELDAYSRALELYRASPMPMIEFEMESVIGEGFTKFGKDLVTTTNVVARFDSNGKMITLFPKLSPLP